MTEKKRNLGSDLAKVDAHQITLAEYAEIPELTKEWFANAELHISGVKVPRGRPRAAITKKATKLRLDPDVLAAFRESGPGWQTRMNAVLRNAVIGRSGKSKKAMTKHAVKRTVIRRSKRKTGT
jgi:uncharacterized protein (DUF4415 family)